MEGEKYVEKSCFKFDDFDLLAVNFIRGDRFCADWFLCRQDAGHQRPGSDQGRRNQHSAVCAGRAPHGTGAGEGRGSKASHVVFRPALQDIGIVPERANCRPVFSAGPAHRGFRRLADFGIGVGLSGTRPVVGATQAGW